MALPTTLEACQQYLKLLRMEQKRLRQEEVQLLDLIAKKQAKHQSSSPAHHPPAEVED